MKLDKLIQLWLNTQKNYISFSTYKRYEGICRNHILPYFGSDAEPNNIKTIEIQQFINYLITKKLAPSTIKKIFIVTRLILKTAKNWDIIKFKLDYDHIILPRVIKKEIALPKLAEIIGAIETQGMFWQCYYRLSIITGARRGEILALKWHDFENRTITLNKSLTINHDGKMCLKSTKGNDSRTIPLDEITWSMLILLQNSKKVYNLDKKEYVFGGENPIYLTTPTKHWTKMLKDNKIQHIKLHSLRHLSATLLLQKGVDIYTVKERLGHKSINTTEIYLHSNLEKSKEATQRIASLL